MSTDIKKKILFLDAYYEPEITAYTHLEKDLIDGLIEANFQITIVCPQPTRGVTKEQHRNYIKNEIRENGNLEVKRFKCLREKKNVILRALRYFIAYQKTYCLAKKEQNVDYIFCNSTPPIQGLLAVKLKKKFNKKHNVKFIYNLQDIFPDSLVNTGLCKQGGMIWKIGRKIENKIYKGADKIITISNSFKNNIFEKGVKPEKVKVVYNWVDLDKVKPIPRKENKLFDELGIDRTKKIVCYAGNFGKAQGIEQVINLAKKLASDNLQFVLFGGGSEFERIKNENSNEEKIKFFPLMPADRVSEVYSLGDINLICCKKGLGKCSFPSKTWSILACNSPIVALYDEDSELAGFLRDNHCGIAVNQEDTSKQVDQIKTIFINKIHNFYIRSIVEIYSSKDRCVSNYVYMFEE